VAARGPDRAAAGRRLLGLSVGRRLSRTAGLPAGAVIYSDTDETGRLAPLISEKYGSVGRPDYLVVTDLGLVPVELKSSRCPAGGPYENHVAQLMGYCLLVEDSLRKPVPEGILRYRDREVHVPFTDLKREWTKALVLAVKEARNGGRIERSHQFPQRCRGCSVNSGCSGSL
jgi:CRISPR/Cas system-associated exonuclease Cas4 (RecB family)